MAVRAVPGRFAPEPFQNDLSAEEGFGHFLQNGHIVADGDQDRQVQIALHLVLHRLSQTVGPFLQILSAVPQHQKYKAAPTPGRAAPVPPLPSVSCSSTVCTGSSAVSFSSSFLKPSSMTR